MKKSNEKITVKNNKHSIDKSNVTTFRSEYIGDFYNFRTRQNCPMTLAGIERLADRMLKWVESPDAIKFNQFLAKENMLYEDFSRFLDKSEDLKKTHKAAGSMRVCRPWPGSAKRGDVRAREPGPCAARRDVFRRRNKWQGACAVPWPRCARCDRRWCRTRGLCRRPRPRWCVP